MDFNDGRYERAMRLVIYEACRKNVVVVFFFYLFMIMVYCLIIIKNIISKGQVDSILVAYKISKHAY